MSLFIDASALVSIIRRESDATSFLTDLHSDGARLTSGLAVWETARAVAKGSIHDTVDAALEEVEQFLAALNIVVVPIGAKEAAEAVHAHARYGKGTGHPARLNMGDCFAYACAKTNNARLLYKGEDFARTDLA